MSRQVKTPLRTVLDLNRDETTPVRWSDGTTATICLRDLKEIRDPFCDAVREAKVRVAVNGNDIWLTAGNYHLPRTVSGVQIDCTVTKGVYKNASKDRWGLDKDARIRIWPAGSPWIAPGTFGYPVDQTWFACNTQMSNEPVYINGLEDPQKKKVYYHSGLDIGGAEGMTRVLSATQGRVFAAGEKALDVYDDTPIKTRYDRVYILDERGWFYLYSHLASIHPGVEPGVVVTKGQPIGLLGKEGASGGWAHLHFEIKAKQPSGKWGTEEGYAFLWQSYIEQYKPTLLAVARPHRLAAVAQPVSLDGSESEAMHGEIEEYSWILSDGRKIHECREEIRYTDPGVYTETLKVTDSDGNEAYDFCTVQVLDSFHEQSRPPSIHAAFHPTRGIKQGRPITFLVRTFNTTHGQEIWDFGDGTPSQTTQSDGCVERLAKDGYAKIEHPYEKPGDYIVTVERANEQGLKASTRLWVHVEA